MAKGTLRVLNLRIQNVRAREKHNRRLYTPEQMPENVIVAKTPGNFNKIVGDKATYKEAIDERLKGMRVRRNSVVAIEFVIGASEDFYKGKMPAGKYLSHCFDFVKKRYGADNVISIDAHYDEANPHVHVLITPVVEKMVKWKNQRGSGMKKEKRLCARDITGGPTKLRALQEDFYQHIRQIERVAGVKFEPRVLAENQTKEYSRKTDYRMAQINRISELARLEVDAAKRLELQKQILKEKAELDKALQLKNEAERKAALNKEINKKLNRNNDQGMER